MNPVIVKFFWPVHLFPTHEARMEITAGQVGRLWYSPPTTTVGETRIADHLSLELRASCYFVHPEHPVMLNGNRYKNL
jgi:hypothetical protein